MKHEEANIQADCFSWFCWQYPQYYGLLFAVPNGEIRDIYTARKLKREGEVFKTLHQTSLYDNYIKGKSFKQIMEEHFNKKVAKILLPDEIKL
jgi:hypothetical protein